MIERLAEVIQTQWERPGMNRSWEAHATVAARAALAFLNISPDSGKVDVGRAVEELRPILTGWEKARSVMGQDFLVKCERELRIEAALRALGQEVDGEEG